MKSVSILIADDHAVVRHGLRVLLETQQGWTICGEAQNGREAIQKAEQLQPDVVILDISMPELNGLVATNRIREVAPCARILVLTMHSSEELIHSCLRAGAEGYILKSDAEHDLISAVNALAQNKTFFTEAATNVLLKNLRLQKYETGDDTVLAGLTYREREIMQLLVEGRTNKEVGARLGIGTRTVESHRESIMNKLHLGTISDLVRYAIRNKVVEP
jgi:DNA-binding NarL/FixJ family response regulator